MDEPGQVAAHHAAQPLADADQLIEVDARVDAHALEHVDEILGGDVAGGARREGTATEAADRQFDRQMGRLIGLGWSRPKAKTADAERMAAKRAKDAAKFADKSEDELIKLKAKLTEAGDLKSMTEATAITKEMAERAKPEMAKLQADIKQLHDTLKKVASDWAKAGTAESVEKLTAGIMAMAK